MAEEQVFDLSKMEPGFGYYVEVHELEKGAKVVLAFCDGESAQDVFTVERDTYIAAERVQHGLRAVATLLNSGMTMRDVYDLLNDASAAVDAFGGVVSFSGYSPLRLFDDEQGLAIVYERDDKSGGFEWMPNQAVTAIDAETIKEYHEHFEFVADDGDDE